jgi:hypothetical protein
MNHARKKFKIHFAASGCLLIWLHVVKWNEGKKFYIGFYGGINLVDS